MKRIKKYFFLEIRFLLMDIMVEAVEPMPQRLLSSLAPVVVAAVQDKLVGWQMQAMEVLEAMAVVQSSCEPGIFT